MAQRYPGTVSPSRILRLPQRLVARGFSESEALAAALDYDLAAMAYGRWVEQRERATVEADAPKKQKPKIHKPKYRTRKEYLGLMDGMPGAESPEAREAREAHERETDALVNRFRGDPDALADYLGL